MATIAVQPQKVPWDGPIKAWLWETLTATNNVGERVFVGHLPSKSIQVMGTFGGPVTFRGSNKPDPDVTVAADWFNLTDPTQTTISFTAAGGKEVMEQVLWVSPAAAAGVSDVDLYLLAAAVRSRV